MKDSEQVDNFPLSERKKLGEAIQRLRVDRGLHQKDLAGAIKKSVATVSLIESGKHPLDYATLVAIARRLDTNPLRLIWDAQRDTLAQQGGLEPLIPVFDTLLTKFEEIESESTNRTQTGSGSQPELNGRPKR